MKKFASVLVVAAVISVPAHATAQTNIAVNQMFQPLQTVLYLPFVVSLSGTFNLETFGTNPIDPYIRLFSNACFTGGCLGAQLAFDDDGGTASGGGSFSNSRINQFLATGDYTVAMSVFLFTEAEARSGTAGFNDFSNLSTFCDDDGDFSDCSYLMTITSNDGIATVVSVPATASIYLIGTGLIAMLGITRRRREDDLDV